MSTTASTNSRAALGSLAALFALVLVALGASAAARSADPAASAAAPDAATTDKARAAYAKLPLAFVPNRGQHAAGVRYAAQAAGVGFFFTEQQALLSFTKGKRSTALALRFLGASPRVRVEGARGLPGRVNYLLGRDPAKWHTNLPTYGELRYRGLWPGIDLVLRGAKGQLKYEFLVRPGARVSDIRLAYRGTGGLSVARGGALRIQTPLGTLTDTAPRSYQLAGGERVPVASRYALQGRRGYGFALGGYDLSRPLVIDPGLLYSTYLGGSGFDRGNDIAVDGAGDAYVTGETRSLNFPTTPLAFDTTFNGGSDAFVTKLNPAGSAPLVYSTYLGGSSNDIGNGIALDTAGNAYVTGQTNSTNFPTTPLAFDTTFNGVSDAFVTKLNPAGSAPLVYSTYLGGSSTDVGNGIALDTAGNAYVTGSTTSTNFPTTPLAFDTTFNGASDAFVTKLNPAGSAPLIYSTYLGGSGFDTGNGIALDTAGNAYVTGPTTSTNFPTTPLAFDTTFNGASDAFVTKLNPAGSAPLVYSTYLGGSTTDIGRGIALDTAGNAYVTGSTTSTNFPTTPLAFDTTFNGVSDAFVTKLNPAGSAPLVYSTYLGGSSFEADFDAAIAVDTAGSAYVTGNTASTNFPTTPLAFDTTKDAQDDAFVTKLNPAGSAPLVYSTYLGGSGSDTGRGIALDPAGNAHVTGDTSSSNFPTTPLAFDTTYNGATDAFVTKLDAIGAPAMLTLSPAFDTNTVGTSHTVTATVTDATGRPVEGIVVRFTVTGSVNTTGDCTTDANGQCDFTYQGPPLPGADAISAYADSDADNTQDPGEPTGAATKAWVLPTSTEFCEVTITQGGWIIAMNGDRANFGGNARVREGGAVEGQENYQDHGPVQPRHVQSIELTAMTCSDDLTEGTIFGRATVDGAGDFVFRIDVTDQGQDDTYGIIMDDGYVSGQQQLQGGNVQIHMN